MSVTTTHRPTCVVGHCARPAYSKTRCAIHANPAYGEQIARMATERLVARMVRVGDLSPAAVDMTPAEALAQWQEANALSDHMACVELARY